MSKSLDSIAMSFEGISRINYGRVEPVHLPKGDYTSFWVEY